MTSNHIFIRSSYEIVRVDLDEIEYVESMENYVRIHLTNGKTIMSLMPLKKILEKLPFEKFVRIHRRFIVSIEKVKKIGTKNVRMNRAELPGGSYLKTLKRSVLNETSCLR